jgi:hypothetical protein
MLQFGGKPTKSSSDSKRHFTVIMGGKEHGLYVSSTPSSAAKKAVTKLCASNKSKKVEFHIRETTQGSKKKTYGPYIGYIEKLREPIELKGRVIKYKPVAKLSGKSGAKKGGMIGGGGGHSKIAPEPSEDNYVSPNNNLAVPAPVSRRIQIPKYAFVNYSDPRYKGQRNAHRTNPNYIAYKQKIKDYATSKKDLREINSDYLSKKIEEFLKTNYDNVQNYNVRRAYEAMQTFKKKEERKKKVNINHPLQMALEQKYTEYKKAINNYLDENNSESKKRKVNELKIELNELEKVEKAIRKKQYNNNPKSSQKFFENISELPTVKGEKIKTFHKMKYPISFREINTKEELIALIYWLKFIDFHRDITNSGYSGHLNYGEERIILDEVDYKDAIENSLRKIFKHVKDIEIEKACRYVFSRLNHEDVNLQEIVNLVEETKENYPNWVKNFNIYTGIFYD